MRVFKALIPSLFLLCASCAMPMSFVQTSVDIECSSITGNDHDICMAWYEGSLPKATQCPALTNLELKKYCYYKSGVAKVAPQNGTCPDGYFLGEDDNCWNKEVAAIVGAYIPAETLPTEELPSNTQAPPAALPNANQMQQLNSIVSIFSSLIQGLVKINQ